MQSLTEGEEGEIDLDSNHVRGSEEDVDPSVCMVGRLVTEKPPNTYYLLDVLKKAWKVRKDFSAREWGRNLFLFKFGTKGDMEWVLRNQPWHYDNHLFVIAPLKGNEQPSMIKLNRASFWVRAYDLPVTCLSKNVARILADRIGIFVDMDENIDSYVGNYLRFKAAIDISKPFLRGLTLKLDGNRLWIPVKYESLPAFCFSCGICGHNMKQCPSGEEKTYKSNEEVPYGPWMNVSPIKRIRQNRMFRWSDEKMPSQKLFHKDTSIPVNPNLKPNDPSHIHQPLQPDKPLLAILIRRRLQPCNPAGDYELPRLELSRARNPETVRELKWQLKHKCPRLVFLMETKLQKDELKTWIRDFYFDDFFVVDCEKDGGGRKGGLALLWTSEWTVHVLSSSSHHINADIDNWRFSGVYGWAENNLTHLTWDLLRDLCKEGSKSWLCAGDFNEILYHHEKSGGVVREEVRIVNFRMALQDCALEDIGYSGFNYTWSNNHEGSKNILERLDRFLATDDWMEKFPLVKVEHLVRVVSDHSLIHLFEIRNKRSQGRKKRIFCNAPIPEE
ncbi:hypothetical protein C2S52_019796 [Perilla frutescens var. hirtella]|nr:hypothetical protein C2S52_019796 [Perilla frutescens var. hirtella]